MSDKTQDLKQKAQDAEDKAIKLSNDRDEAVQKVRDRFDDKLRKANLEAAEAQKAWMDAEAADALRDRPDGEVVARTLGLDLG